MAEWEVFAAFVAVMGFCLTVFKISGFFNSLDSSMKMLNASITRLNEELKESNKTNKESHARLWHHNEEQDEKLNDHETRLKLIEKRRISNELESKN